MQPFSGFPAVDGIGCPCLPVRHFIQVQSIGTFLWEPSEDIIIQSNCQPLYNYSPANCFGQLAENQMTLPSEERIV